MGVSQRIARLDAERRLHPPTRTCTTCRSWPHYRIVYDPLVPGLHPTEPAGPAVCPTCGHEPETIRVVYDDWHGSPATIPLLAVRR